MFRRLKGWLPPESIRLMRDWSGYGVRFEGEYTSWEEAAQKARGYDEMAILQEVSKATLAVRDGKAVFERDGVLFSESDSPYPLLAGLLRVAALEGGRLDVLDFGGGLGSSYFQCRSWLNNLATLSWRVVEQPNYVKLGRAQLADQVLSFFDCIDKSTAGHSPNVAIFSGVLQYLPDPSSILARIAEIGIRHIIIDRTPIISGKRNILAVQVVPVRILDSSYPVRLFSRQSVLQPLEGKYRVMAEFPAVDGMLGGLRRRVEFRGFILEKKFV